MMDLERKKVLVTGASSGLGREMCLQLARDYRCDLIIVARRQEKLESLAESIQTSYHVQVTVICADMSLDADVDRLLHSLSVHDLVDVAVLNAGLTYFGENLSLPKDRLDKMIQTNIMGVVRLANGLAQIGLSQNRPLFIQIISSMAALFPAPYQSVYSGTKAFLLAYATAFNAELKDSNVAVGVFAPGGMKTEMTEDGSFDALQKWLMPVSSAAQAAICAIQKKKLLYIPGAVNRLGAFFMRLMPRKMLAARMAKIYAAALHDM